eukprot:m.228874 g.228874  ORF g.228874 m.228874 type:complete len:122 (-) comp18833_c0_seq9:1717-2082(-)
MGCCARFTCNQHTQCCPEFAAKDLCLLACFLVQAKKRSKDDPEVIVEGVGTDKLLEITSKIVVQATHDLATVIGMDPEGSSQRRVATMREEGLHSSRQSPEPNNDAASHEASSSSDLGQRP